MMKCILMNKNTPVMTLEFNTLSNYIDEIYEVLNISYAPLSVYNAYNSKNLNLLRETNDWFRGRGIPSWRKDLEKMLEKLNITSPLELLNKSYALSLSDQYWLKEDTSVITYQDINFFTNDFLYEAYLDAVLNESANATSTNKDIFRSPNNTTDGMLQKAWIIKDGKRVLVKGTYTASREEPINEWLASRIAERLGFSYCDYKISYSSDIKLCSLCDNFITSDEEIITAYDIYKSEKKPNNINDYEFYISILEKHGIKNVRESLENMFILDYIMLNSDRHLKNFGIIRDVNTLKWLRVTPIFDMGESMQCDRVTDELNFNEGSGKFFSNTSKKYEDILKILGKGILRIDIKALEGICDEYRNMLLTYQTKIDISDKRIDKLCEGLMKRISKIHEHIEKLKN